MNLVSKKRMEVYMKDKQFWTIKQTDEYGKERYLWAYSWIRGGKPLKFYNSPDCPVYIMDNRAKARYWLKELKRIHPCACEEGRFKVSIVKWNGWE